MYYNYLRIGIFSFILATTLIRCGENTPKPLSDGIMEVSGKIDGLRKGTLYLQKVKDSILMNIDSTIISGTPEFRFSTTIETPEIFYLYLNKEDSDSLNDRILFFGEPGRIEIQTLLKTFESSATIKGSKNQELLQEYISFNRKFNDQNLDLLQKFFRAQQLQQNERVDSLQKAMDNLLRRRYLYTINFAANHTDENIAPYLALTQVYDANLSLLDSIAVKMTPEVKGSKYGKEFLNFLEERRKEEAKD
ncbi:MAG: DUF4369 domain-containing protein [Flavobacteriaceae bacterium]|nr:DUF4369 domain-containing protein [Flavobacteriaceae bacterium]